MFWKKEASISSFSGGVVFGVSDRSDRSDRGHFNSATKKSVWEAMKANGWGWEAMSFASHFPGLIFGILGRGISNAAKVCQSNCS